MNFSFTLWDVEHGLAIWIQTPNGKNFCIDAGHNNENDFCPYKHMKDNYSVNQIDYLVISHPDKDHIEGLPSMIENLGRPKVLCRNKTIPDEMKYGSCKSEYQNIFKELDTSYTKSVEWEKSPANKNNNGNVFISSFHNTYCDGMTCNNTSIVVFFRYNNVTFVCPGDIEPEGWKELYKNNSKTIDEIVDNSIVFLVAPHHGRPSGYCEDMINILHPSLILVSDKYAKHETASEYYRCATGINLNGKSVKSLSTKTKGRIKIIVDNNGRYTIDYTSV